MSMGSVTKLFFAALIMSLGFLAAAVACPDSGQPAQDFSLQPVGGGKSVALSQMKGKPTLVVFWATWCPPCRREIPVLKEMYVKYGTKLNLLGVAVNYRQTEKDVARFSEANSLQYTVLWDAENKAADNYCVSGIPTVVLVDPEGVIRFRGGHISESLVDLLDSYTGKKTVK
jgi:thiol-disulfide isomerase/thioredoxin